MNWKRTALWRWVAVNPLYISKEKILRWIQLIQRDSGVQGFNYMHYLPADIHPGTEGQRSYCPQSAQHWIAPDEMVQLPLWSFRGEFGCIGDVKITLELERYLTPASEGRISQLAWFDSEVVASTMCSRPLQFSVMLIKIKPSLFHPISAHDFCPCIIWIKVMKALSLCCGAS